MKRFVLAITALSGLVVVVLWMAGVFNHKIQPDLKPVSDTGMRESVTIDEESMVRVEKIPGSIAARDATRVASRLLARVSTLTVRPGDLVTAGELLATLEKDDLTARVRQAEESLNSITARYQEASMAFERAQSLRRKQLISQADLDAAKANIVSFEAQRAAAEQSVDEVKTALSWSRIHAPISGRVVERLVEPGDTVHPGQPIVALYNPSTLRVEAWVRESLAVKLVVGQPLEVSVPALDITVAAAIEEIVPVADPGSRAFKVRLLMPLLDRLVPGMYAEVSVTIDTARSLLIPSRFIREVGQLDVVWVQGVTGPERRFIRTGSRYHDKIEVVSGLSKGETLLAPPRDSDR